MRFLNRARPAVLAVVLAGAVSMFGAAVALANHPILSGQAACNQGQFVITWTVQNSETTIASGGTGRTMTISALSVAPGSLPVSGISVGQVLQPQPLSGSSATGTTTVPGSTTGNVTLSVTGHFFEPNGTDTGLIDTETVSVGLSGGCVPGGQTIAGHIYDCTSGSPTTHEVLGIGGTLGASGPQTVPTQANPLNPTSVAAGSYSMSAGITAPRFQFVACISPSPVTITTPSTATQTVTVPSGGAGVGIFYVSEIPVTQTIAGHIYDCTGGTPTTNEISGGMLGATGPQTVPTQANPLNPTSVAAGTYTMTETTPSGYQLVACNGVPGTPTQSVTVPSGGAGVGIFYVKLVPTTCTASSSANASGNSGQVQPGQYLWFNFHFKPNSTPNVLTTYYITNLNVQFMDTLTNKAYSVAAPSATITLNDSSGSAPTSNFVSGQWIIQIPPSSSNADEIFMTGFSWQNTGSVAVQPKNFNIAANFRTSTGGTSVQWQFGVALYNSHFMDNGYNGLGVLLIHQSDHAGTPENEKVNFIGGAGTGGGGSNFTGSWSNSPNATCQ